MQKCHDNANLKGKTQICHDNANLKGKMQKCHDNAMQIIKDYQLY
jgi:hypothetical protein